MSFSFIPVYVSMDEEDAKSLANALMSLLWVVSSLICVFSIVFMDQLLPVLVGGGGYEKIVGKVELTVLLARIMFIYLFLVTTYAYYMSILNVLGEFFIPALAPAFFNGALILASLWAGFSQSPLYLAWGVCLAEFCKWARLLGSGEEVKAAKVDVEVEGAGGLFLVLRKMVPSLMGIGVLQLMTLVNIYFASYLTQGSHSFLYLGQRILELPQSLISVSLSAALLPTLSRLGGAGKTEGMLSLLGHHVKLLLFLTLPCAVFMYILSEPIVVTLFLRGEFSVEDAKLTASVISIFSLLLLIGGMNRVMVTVLYSVKNTWYPALVSFVCLLFHIGMAQLLIEDYGVKGLVGSMVISGFCNVSAIFIGIRLFVGDFPLGGILFSQWKTGVAALGMGGVVFLLYDVYTRFFGSFYETLFDWGLFLALFLGVGVYFCMAYLLKSELCEEVKALFWDRFKRSAPQTRGKGVGGLEWDRF